MKQSQTVMPYVDIETPKVKWYIYHSFVLVTNLALLAIGALVIEYTVAKITNPNVFFLPLPVPFTLICALLVIGLAIVNLATLIFVFWRHLWLRRWLLGTTFAGFVIIALLILVLQDRFLTILLPWYHPPL